VDSGIFHFKRKSTNEYVHKAVVMKPANEENRNFLMKLLYDYITRKDVANQKNYSMI